VSEIFSPLWVHARRLPSRCSATTSWGCGLQEIIYLITFTLNVNQVQVSFVGSVETIDRVLYQSKQRKAMLAGVT
jgi:hypothetical protein